MAKIHIEVCLISARGLRRSSSLWKLQWFAVGWIDPDHKYCTKIDGSGSSNPTWKTKFSVSIDGSKLDVQSLALTVQVYSRDPIFLREKLRGTSSIQLKEFFTKFANNQEIEEVGSFQLRKRNSGKPRGFIDVSIQMSEEREGASLYAGNEEGFNLSNWKNDTSLEIEDGSIPSYPTQPLPAPVGRPGYYQPERFPYTHPTPMPINYSNPSTVGTSYRPPCTPPPPPPPSNVGFLPTLLPGTGQLPNNYVNMPSTAPGARTRGPGFGMGVGAGAMAAGAMIFGDDFMSGFDFPAGFQGGSLTISADNPF